MTSRILACVLFAGAVSAARAHSQAAPQAVPAALSFEVASIKQNNDINVQPKDVRLWVSASSYD